MRFNLAKLFAFDKRVTGTNEMVNDFAIIFGKVREVVNPETGQVEYRRWKTPQPRKGARLRCGARCRDGHACQRLAVEGRRRCPNHGGLSTGPRTEAGRARIAESNRRRARSPKC